MTSDIKQRIRTAVLRSIKSRNQYSDSITANLTKSLNQAEQDVSKAILKYNTLGSLPDNKLAALKGLEKLREELDDITNQLLQEQTLVFRNSTKDSFKKGIFHGITELTTSQLPFYTDLKPDDIDKLKVFTIIDTDALDFLTQYNLTLAGDINRELSDGIKRVIMQGIIQGKGTDDIVRDLGHVVIYKDSFKQAGTKVFSTAQYRMEMIARTEVLRAHNMGRIKFHRHIGIQKLEWMTMDDERTCPVCGRLNGKTFSIDKFPSQPAHPFCRCCNLPVLDNIKLKKI